MIEKRVALIGIIIEDTTHIAELNHILATYAEYTIGRMGLPYKERDIHIISIIVDAPSDLINSLSGKLGKLSGISVKTMYSKI